MSITPLDSGDKEYLTDENHSVKKWWYQGDDYKSAQLIKELIFVVRAKSGRSSV